MSESTDHAPFLLEGSAPKRLAAFSAPLVAANLLQYVYQFVDMGVVGNVVGEAGQMCIRDSSQPCAKAACISLGVNTPGKARMLFFWHNDTTPGWLSLIHI